MSTLEPFFGNADKKAEVVDAMHITHLHSWFEACKWKMSAAQLSESHQVSGIRCNGAPVRVHQLEVWVRKLYCKPSKVQPQYHTLI